MHGQRAPQQYWRSRTRDTADISQTVVNLSPGLGGRFSLADGIVFAVVVLGRVACDLREKGVDFMPPSGAAHGRTVGGKRAWRWHV